MKKNVTLMLTILVTLCAVAQQMDYKNFTVPFKPTKFEQKQMKTAPNLNLFGANTLPVRKAATKVAAGELDTLQYLRPEGTFFAGVTSDFVIYNPMIITDTVPFTFFDYSYMHSTNLLYWMFSDDNESLYITTEPQDEFEYPAMSADEYFINPILASYPQDADLENDEPVQTYQYGYSTEDGGSIFYVKPLDSAGNQRTFPLTTCAMYTDENIGGDDYGNNDFFAISAGQYGDYAYGSNLHFNFSDIGEVTVDTIIVMFDNVTTLWMDSAFLPIFNFNASTAAEMIPADATIKMDVLPVTIENNMYTLHPSVSSTTATLADLNAYQAKDGGMLGTLNFAFGAKNALGGFTSKPVVLSGYFAIQISGISSNNCDFGIFSDYFYPVSNTYFCLKGFIAPIWESGNIALSLNAMFVNPADYPVTTDVENTTDSNVSVNKVVVDGQVLIQKNDKTYNVLGAEVK